MKTTNTIKITLYTAATAAASVATALIEFPDNTANLLAIKTYTHIKLKVSISHVVNVVCVLTVFCIKTTSINVPII
jgi:hypothetical protein